jgi:hypothetical protein
LRRHLAPLPSTTRVRSLQRGSACCPRQRPSYIIWQGRCIRHVVGVPNFNTTREKRVDMPSKLERWQPEQPYVELFPDVVYSGPLLRPNSKDKAAANAKRGSTSAQQSSAAARELKKLKN